MLSSNIMESDRTLGERADKLSRIARPLERCGQIALLVSATSLFFGLAAVTVKADDFRCPQIRNFPIPQQVAAQGKALPAAQDLEQPSELASAVELLREHGLSTDSTINYLIAQYCPIVGARDDLSAGEKTNLVRRFASEVMRTVFISNSVQDVIFDVPLSPQLAEATTARANEAGLTVQQWITRAVAASVR